MSGDPRGVLVHWALPLLARARRIADDIAERGCEAANPSVCAQLGDDIAALIGHSVTDAPPADELDEILADVSPVRPQVPPEVRAGTRAYFEAANSGEPAARAVPEEAAPPEPCTVCRCQRCHQVIERADGAGSWRHIGTRTFDHGALPFDHAPGALYHGAPVACDGCDMKMVHYFGPRDAPMARRFDEAGHPPNCPAYTPPADAKAVHVPTGTFRTAAGGVSIDLGKLIEPPALDPDRTPRIRLGDRTTSVVFESILPEPVLLVPAACWPDEPESGEPAAPVETPEARARRLDRERDDAGRAYRAAIYDADQAWREIGGR